MKIQSLHLKNFKRFTDLKIESIPAKAKLILLIGSNGSGKSSVFDAFEYFNAQIRHDSAMRGEFAYYRKDRSTPIEIKLLTTAGEEWLANERTTKTITGKSLPFYGRSSFRQVPRLSRKHLGSKIDVKGDADRPRTFIDRDERFENDIELISEQVLKKVFREKVSQTEIEQTYIQPINAALENIFGSANGTKLALIEIIPPLEGKISQINFRKGTSEIHYNNLSAGEKEVVNILFNLLVRRNEYPESIYFFDEIDLHLNTKLQYNLLKEITENWIPEHSQFWTASHSLGFIQYANDSDPAVIIDFDDLDFDKPCVLTPAIKNRYEIFELAVSKEFIDQIFQGRRIVFAENSDTPLYNDLSLDGTFFFKANDKNDVFHKAKNLNAVGLVDRDYLTDEEINQIRQSYPFIRVLPYYSIENLLYHPDNLEEYFKGAKEGFDKEGYIHSILQDKDQERDYITAGITKARDGYPFFKDNEQAKQMKSFKENWKNIVEMLRSADFETAYKVFPAKDYGKQIAERQNIDRRALAKTQWFKQKINEALA